MSGILRLETLRTDPICPEEFVEIIGNNKGEKKFVQAIRPLWNSCEIYHEPIMLVLEEEDKCKRCIPDFLVRMNNLSGLLVEVSTSFPREKRRQKQIMQRVGDIDDWDLKPGIHLDHIFTAIICQIDDKNHMRIRSELYSAFLQGLEKRRSQE